MKASTKEKYGKILYRLEKIKARNYCLLQESQEDPWFVYVRKLDLKTQKETDCQMIIAKDIPQWMSSLENSGWVQKDIV